MRLQNGHWATTRSAGPLIPFARDAPHPAAAIWTTFQRSVRNEPAVRFWIEPQEPECGPDRSSYSSSSHESLKNEDLPGSPATADIRAGNSAGRHWPRDPDSELVADALSTSPRR